MGSLARKLPPPDEERSTFAADVLAGLSASPKRLPPKYFYDDAGSLLFERITELPEYYPTRCEMSILRVHAADICRLIPEGAALIEFGAGAAKKARILLRAAPQLAAYVPVDICGEMIEREAAELRADFPQLQILPVAADICYPFDLPREARVAPNAGYRRKVELEIDRVLSQDRMQHHDDVVDDLTQIGALELRRRGSSRALQSPHELADRAIRACDARQRLGGLRR